MRYHAQLSANKSSVVSIISYFFTLLDDEMWSAKMPVMLVDKLPNVIPCPAPIAPPNIPLEEPLVNVILDGNE
jgi:hypothetical protein